MSTNPRILSIPPQPNSSTSHVHRYFETFVPHLPQLAQEGYEQFEHDYRYGSDPIHSYKQDDGSSSTLDRQALVAANGPGRGNLREARQRRVEAPGLEVLQEYHGNDGRWRTREEEGNGQPRASSTPPVDRWDTGEAMSARSLQRHASAPSRPRSHVGRYRREGVEQLAARRTNEARQGRKPQYQEDAEDNKETESAHRRFARKMRRREKAAIRRPPPLLRPPSPPPLPRHPHNPRRSYLSEEDSISEISDRRPAKRSKAAHIGGELMRDYRSGHVTTGRLTLRPGQTKGQGFLGKAKSSGAIIGGRDRRRNGQESADSDSSRADWAEKWRRPEPLTQPQAQEAEPRAASPLEDRRKRLDAGEEEARAQREMEIVRNSKIPEPGRTGSPSWPSINSHDASHQGAGPGSRPTNPDRQHAPIDGMIDQNERSAPRDDPHDKAIEAIALLRDHAIHQPIDYLRVAHPSSKAVSPWRPRAATGFGRWAHAGPSFGRENAEPSVPPDSAQVLTSNLARQLHLPASSAQASAPVPLATAATFGRASTTANPGRTLNGSMPSGQAMANVAQQVVASGSISHRSSMGNGAVPVAPLIRLASPGATRPDTSTANAAKPLIRLNSPNDPRSSGTPARSPLIKLHSSTLAQDLLGDARRYDLTFGKSSGLSMVPYGHDYHLPEPSLQPTDHGGPHPSILLQARGGQRMPPNDVNVAYAADAQSSSIPAGPQLSSDEAENPFLSHHARTEYFNTPASSRDVRPRFSFPMAQAASFSTPRMYDNTPVKASLPINTFGTQIQHDEFPSKYQHIPFTPLPPVSSPSASSNPFAVSSLQEHSLKHNPVLATPLARHVEDDLQNFWSKRRAFR